MIRTPIAVNTASNAAMNLASRSRIKNLKPPACLPLPPAGTADRNRRLGRVEALLPHYWE